MQASGNPFTRSLAKWILPGAAVATLLAFIIQLRALEQLVDRPVALFFASQRDTMLVHVARFLTDFGKAYWSIVPAAALFVLFRFGWRRPLHASQALFVLLSVAASGLFVDILKFIFGRSRPDLLLHHDIFQFFFFRFGREYNSFPSGHTASAMAAGMALALIFPRYRAVALAGAIVLACTRFITTQHYISDVVASSMIAVVIVMILRVVSAKHGLALSRDETATNPPVHDLVAKMIGVPSGPATATASLSTIVAPSVFGVVVVAMAVATCGLVPDLALIEWQEYTLPNFDPAVEPWLWASLDVCMGFGVLAWIHWRTARTRLIG